MPYFTTPGYADPVDGVARIGLIAALVLLVISVVMEIGAHSLAVPRPPKDPLEKAQHKTEHADDFVKAAKERARRKIDAEDVRHDDPK